MIEIPPQLQRPDFRFILLEPRNKIPIESAWTTSNNYSFDSAKLSEHLKNGGNYGMLCGIGGLAVVDADTPEIREIVTKLPKTFTVRTGSGGQHSYFLVDGLNSKFVLRKGGKHYGEVQSVGSQVVGAGCVHPNGNTYSIVDWGAVAVITAEQLRNVFAEYCEDVKASGRKVSPIHDEDILSRLTDSGLVQGERNDILFRYTCNLREHGHDSAFIESHLRAANMRCNSPLPENEIHTILTQSMKYGSGKSPTKAFFTAVGSAIQSFSSARDLVEQLYRINPFFYDRNHLWWFWNTGKKCYEIVDETDLLVTIDKALSNSRNTIESRLRNEIIEALKRVGRENIPKEPDKWLVQFRNGVINVKTGDKTEPSPELFFTNPIPQEIGKNEDTPTIDGLFDSWVGGDYIVTLHEIVAYCLLRDYPIHRIFALTGSGANGKSRFLALIGRFLGEDNVSSTSISGLIFNRFESTKLYRKLFVQMGETNFGSLKNTDRLKRLSGQDLVGIEFKNKNPFDFVNYAKIAIATNALPKTYDRTDGFYRRWLIVDFPNKFPEGKDILDTIPPEEYANLARKSIRILKELIERGKFTKEGTIEERKARYEEHSNSVAKFIREYCRINPEGYIALSDFCGRLHEWLARTGNRILTAKEAASNIRDEGYEIRKKHMGGYDGDTTIRAILGLSFADTIDTEDTQVPVCSPIGIQSENTVSMVSKVSDKPNTTAKEPQICPICNKERQSGDFIYCPCRVSFPHLWKNDEV